MTIKDVKRNFVTECACDLFLERSMPSVTIRDIAQRSGVGEATVYRYFSTRSELIVACAVRLQEKVELAFSDVRGAVTGWQKIERFYKTYLELFLKDPALYRFLNEFDAYCINEGVVDLEKYAENMDRFKTFFCLAYDEGVADGTVRRLDDVDIFYYTTTHAVLSLCKKLAVGGAILRQDKLTDKAAEIRTLIDIILHSLKATE